MSVDSTIVPSLRVCHVITGLGQGGAENALCRLVEGDHFRNQTVVVSLTGRGLYADRLEAANATVEALSIAGPSSFISGLIRLYQIYKNNKPDVVQTWMYHSDLMGGVVARLMGIPVAWGLRQGNLSGKYVKAGTWFVGELNAFFSRMVPTVIVACGQRVVNYHKALRYRGKFVVIPNGLELADYPPDSGNATAMRNAFGLGEAFVVGHVGRADTQKDHGTLLAAFKLFLTTHPDSRLLLIGAGLEEGSAYLTKFIDYTATRANVLALGARVDVPKLLQVFDVFVLSSVSEGFPNVVAEAMASGVPCVVTDCGDAAEMVGETGWTVPVKHPDAIAHYLSLAAAESPSQRIQRSRAARFRAEQNFGIKEMVDAYQRVWFAMVK